MKGKKKQRTAYEEATLHLTPKEKERAEKEIGKEKIIQIDKVLKHAFSKINVYKYKMQFLLNLHYYYR